MIEEVSPQRGELVLNWRGVAIESIDVEAYFRLSGELEQEFQFANGPHRQLFHVSRSLASSLLGSPAAYNLWSCQQSRSLVVGLAGWCRPISGRQKLSPPRHEHSMGEFRASAQSVCPSMRPPSSCKASSTTRPRVVLLERDIWRRRCRCESFIILLRDFLKKTPHPLEASVTSETQERRSLSAPREKLTL